MTEGPMAESFTFTWPMNQLEEGNHYKYYSNANIYITGDFDDWSKTTKLSPNYKEQYYEINLPIEQFDDLGRFNFKFYFADDDSWKCNSTYPIENDGHGNENNYITGAEMIKQAEILELERRKNHKYCEAEEMNEEIIDELQVSSSDDNKYDSEVEVEENENENENKPTSDINERLAELESEKEEFRKEYAQDQLIKQSVGSDSVTEFMNPPEHNEVSQTAPAEDSFNPIENQNLGDVTENNEEHVPDLHDKEREDNFKDLPIKTLVNKGWEEPEQQVSEVQTPEQQISESQVSEQVSEQIPEEASELLTPEDQVSEQVSEQTPEFQTPELQTPELLTSKDQVSEQQASELQASELQTPELQTPEDQVSEQVSEQQAPGLQTPELQTPELQTSELQTSEDQVSEQVSEQIPEEASELQTSEDQVSEQVSEQQASELQTPEQQIFESQASELQAPQQQTSEKQIPEEVPEPQSNDVDDIPTENRRKLKIKRKIKRNKKTGERIVVSQEIFELDQDDNVINTYSSMEEAEKAKQPTESEEEPKERLYEIENDNEADATSNSSVIVSLHEKDRDSLSEIKESDSSTGEEAEIPMVNNPSDDAQGKTPKEDAEIPMVINNGEDLTETVKSNEASENQPKLISKEDKEENSTTGQQQPTSTVEGAEKAVAEKPVVKENVNEEQPEKPQQVKATSVHERDDVPAYELNDDDDGIMANEEATVVSDAGKDVHSKPIADKKKQPVTKKPTAKKTSTAIEEKPKKNGVFSKLKRAFF